jgi:hypothetical protein
MQDQTVPDAKVTAAKHIHRIRSSSSNAIVLTCGGWFPALLSSR